MRLPNDSILYKRIVVLIFVNYLSLCEDMAQSNSVDLVKKKES